MIVKLMLIIMLKKKVITVMMAVMKWWWYYADNIASQWWYSISMIIMAVNDADDENSFNKILPEPDFGKNNLLTQRPFWSFCQHLLTFVS